MLESDFAIISLIRGGDIYRALSIFALDSAESTDKKGGPRTPFAFSATFLVVLDIVLVVL